MIKKVGKELIHKGSQERPEKSSDHVNSQFYDAEEDAMISASEIEAESTSSPLKIGCATLSQASGAANATVPVEASAPIQAQSSPALNVPK